MALETADVVIMGDDLRKLGDIFRLGRRVQRVVKQNLIIAFGVMGFLLPVSYTHLRAHETVLDLVCRLLLEKKNHYIILTTHLHLTV